MKRIVRLTESDLTRIVRRIINEQPEMAGSTLGTAPKIKGTLIAKVKPLTANPTVKELEFYGENIGTASGTNEKVLTALTRDGKFKLVHYCTGNRTMVAGKPTDPNLITFNNFKTYCK